MTTLARAPLRFADGVRSRLYRLGAPYLGGLLADRARRVRWLACGAVATSLTLTLVAPLWLLALGPVLLGVPHLLADLRYLVAQPGLHRHGAASWAAALPLVAVGFGAPAFVGLLSVVPLALLPAGQAPRKLLALGAWLALTLLALRFEFTFLLVFLHLHNLVALGFWWAWQPRTRATWWVPALVLAALVLLLSGAADGVVTAFGTFVATHAPGLPPRLAGRLVLTFAFLQSLHYAVWLRLVPEDARVRRAPRPFLASWAALQRDLGRPLLVAGAALALVVAAWGAFDLAQAREGYLRLATFHGYLELAAAAFFFVAGQRPRPR